MVIANAVTAEGTNSAVTPVVTAESLGNVCTGGTSYYWKNGVRYQGISEMFDGNTVNDIAFEIDESLGYGLSSPKFITKIKLYQKFSQYGSTSIVTAFRVEASNDFTNWDAIASYSSLGAETTTMTATFVPVVEYLYWRIVPLEFWSDYYWGLCEIEMYEERVVTAGVDNRTIPAPATTVISKLETPAVLSNSTSVPASPATATSRLVDPAYAGIVYTADLCVGGTAISGGNNASYPAANAYDNGTSNYWQSSQTGTAVNGTAWIGYSFATAAEIRLINIMNNNSTRSVSSVKVQASNDNFATIVNVATLSTPTTTNVWLPLYIPPSAQYLQWRLLANASLTTTYAWQIKEIEMKAQAITVDVSVSATASTANTAAIVPVPSVSVIITATKSTVINASGIPQANSGASIAATRIQASLQAFPPVVKIACSVAAPKSAKTSTVVTPQVKGASSLVSLVSATSFIAKAPVVSGSSRANAPYAPATVTAPIPFVVFYSYAVKATSSFAAVAPSVDRGVTIPGLVSTLTVASKVPQCGSGSAIPAKVSTSAINAKGCSIVGEANVVSPIVNYSSAFVAPRILLNSSLVSALATANSKIVVPDVKIGSKFYTYGFVMIAG